MDAVGGLAEEAAAPPRQGDPGEIGVGAMIRGSEAMRVLGLTWPLRVHDSPEGRQRCR